MQVTVTRRCSIQPSIASTVDAGHVFHGVASVSTDGAPKGHSRLVGSNGVPFLLPTDAFRVDGGLTFHGVMVAGARKSANTARSERIHKYVAERACR